MQPPTERQSHAQASAADSMCWSATRPSLEYQHAFDFCAVEAHRTEGHVALLASSPFYAREMLRRLRGSEASLIPVGGWDASAAGAAVADPSVQAKAAVWAGPEQQDGEQVLEQVDQVLVPEGCLYIVTSGWLARFLPEWQRDADRPGERPASPQHTAGWLRRGGFVVESAQGFHGPESTLWGYTSRLMAALGRGDLADRCYFQMRARYVVSGWQARLAPVVVLVARKRLGHD